MFDARRRRLAWLFALVLLSGLAVLCCASAHFSVHDCCGDDCAICALMRCERDALLVVAAFASGFALTILTAAKAPRRLAAGAKTPVSRRVRLND